MRQQQRVKGFGAKIIVMGCSLMLGTVVTVQSQSVTGRLQQAMQQLDNDAQLKHATISLYVIDAATGKEVYGKNEEVGLAPASTQKLFTSAAAFDLLGPGYQFETRLSIDGQLTNGVLNGNLHITGGGDPTLGSWRWDETKTEQVLNKIVAAVQQAGIKSITGKILLDESGYELQPLPDGWIWQDIGNYYGAGSRGINWHENQYDMELKPGDAVGAPTTIDHMEPSPEVPVMMNQIKTGAKGSGDHGYIYLPPFSQFGFTVGTIPLQSNLFGISGSLPYPALSFGKSLEKALAAAQISCAGIQTWQDKLQLQQSWPVATQTLASISSPTLDKVIYWFLRKSINLYGEALAKAIARDKGGLGSTDGGIELIKDFWQGKGIDKEAMHILDGSGLSPQNRVTTHAEVQVLQYAQNQPWFDAFYESLPVYNGMKMKSGSIGGARAYAGYQTAADGKKYIFSIIVNNYSGQAGTVLQKMYKVLDILK